MRFNSTVEWKFIGGDTNMYLRYDHEEDDAGWKQMDLMKKKSARFTEVAMPTLDSVPGKV